MAQITGIHVGDTGSTYDVDTNVGAVSDETQRIVFADVSTATTSSVSATTASSTLAAAAAARGGLAVFNDSTSAMRVKLGTGASSTSFLTVIPSQGLWELPAGRLIYTGAVTGIWDTATGAARVTEW